MQLFTLSISQTFLFVFICVGGITTVFLKQIRKNRIKTIVIYELYHVSSLMLMPIKELLKKYNP
ncbi:MAG: hypothetical protein HNEKOMLI_00141 [Sodalis sp. Psp]|nr:hypothetical protein [Sodalis sp. Psp]MCR3756638.1 hypothetical protein [Sodalis sp. Ppy]